MKATYAYWLNLGGDMALVNESGTLIGRLMPMEDKIYRATKRALYEPARPFKMRGHRFTGEPPDREERKGA